MTASCSRSVSRTPSSRTAATAPLRESTRSATTPTPETGELVDSTELDPGATWAAGGMLSTPSELNTFMQALFGGELTSAAALKEMPTTVPAEEDVWPGAAYGLGVESFPLDCDSGDAVTTAVTALPSVVIDPSDEAAVLDSYRSVFQAMNDALCADSPEQAMTARIPPARP